PENISPHRLIQLRGLGADVAFTPATQYSAGYVRELEARLQQARSQYPGPLSSHPRRLYAVTKIHPDYRVAHHTVVDEYMQQASAAGNPRIDYLVAAAGSGTSLSGIGRRVKSLFSEARVVAVEPASAPAIAHLAKHGVPLQFDEA